MISKIIEFSVRNRWLMILVWIGIALWGVYAMIHTPIDAIPDLSENQVIVFTDWMGRSPQDIEEQITYPLSVQLQALAGVKAVRSSSEPNFSMIYVIFEDSVDPYFARQRILERLTTARASLPAEAAPQLAPDATALGQIFWYTVEGGGKSLDELRALQDFNVRYQLAAIPGVAEVAGVGGFVREYQIDIDPARLRLYNLPLSSVFSAVASSNMTVGGKVIASPGSEYMLRGVGWLRGISDIENTVVETRNGVPILLSHLAKVQLGPAFRRSALEKNGSEAVGGVVMMRIGENPLRITEAIKQKIREIEPGLPAGVKIVPFYDRTRLIKSAIHTVTGTLKEEMIIASIAILLILAHFRSAVVVCVTLPVAVLISFLFMYYLKMPSNIMSLCGIAISIGILVDAAVVMVENATHELKSHFGEKRITGDTSEIVIRSCRLVGQPIFFSVLIMLVSFLPVFVFGGQGGKLSHPLAYTKTFAMFGVALSAITLVPALIPLLVRGRLKSEEDNRIVRSFIDIYKPVLSWMIDRPRVVWVMLFVIIFLGRVVWSQLGSEFMPSLDEGSLMDMPVSSPRIPMAQAIDDVKVRDAVLHGFPEVESAVGKIGRADTATDPSPLEMVETIIMFHPNELWPKRAWRYADAKASIADLISQIPGAKLSDSERTSLEHEIMEEFDRQMRSFARSAIDKDSNWKDNLGHINLELRQRAAGIIPRITIDAIEKTNKPALSEDQKSQWCKSQASRIAGGLLLWTKTKNEIQSEMDSQLQMPGWGNIWTQPIKNRIDMLATGVRTPVGVKVFGPTGKPVEQAMQDIQKTSQRIAERLRTVNGAVNPTPDPTLGKRYLEVHIDRARAARYGVSMAEVSEAVETALGGATVTNTVEGRNRFAVRLRYSREQWQDIESIRNVLVTGRSTSVSVPESPAKVQSTGTSNGGGMGGGSAPKTMSKASGMGDSSGMILIPLSEVADINIVEGPSMIKSENGRLYSNVVLDVAGRDLVGFVDEARGALVDIEKDLAGTGMSIQWTGEFEQQARTRQTLILVFPMVVLLILFLLYITFKDVMDMFLVFLAVLGCLSGAVMFQWLFGFHFSVVVSIGYIAAFGMATQTGVIMLVYLREAIEKHGGLDKIQSLEDLRKIVIEGAVHRLRPKLLTEGTAIIGLVPMLWATGTGAEIMQPMAAPVLGGLLISDEVIDLTIPVLFYWIRRSRWIGRRQEQEKPTEPS